MTDDEAKEIIRKEFKIKNILELKDFEKEKRNTNIKLLKNKGRFARQPERLMGISRAVILKSKTQRTVSTVSYC